MQQQMCNKNPDCFQKSRGNLMTSIQNPPFSLTSCLPLKALKSFLFFFHKPFFFLYFSWAMTLTAVSTSLNVGNQCFRDIVLSCPISSSCQMLLTTVSSRGMKATLFASQMTLESETFSKNQSGTLMRMYFIAHQKLLA